MDRPDAPRLPAGLPFGWRGVGLVLGGVLLLSALLEPAWLAHLPGLCLVRHTTGVPCPGCGLTRSFVATAHGDLGPAFRFHPFGPVLLAACVLGLALLLVGALRRRSPVSARTLARLRPAAWAVLAAWLLWAGVRAVSHVL